MNTTPTSFSLNKLKWPVVLIAGCCLVWVYKIYDPSQAGFFPQCPFHGLTGFDCPGCGSQRAVHDLLNFQFVKAFQQNALLVVSIPYLLLGFGFERIKPSTEKKLLWRKRLFGKTAIYCIVAIVMAFWVLRNIL